MRLDIRGLNLDLTDAILEHVQQQIKEALSGCQGKIIQIHIRVNDVNGPHGGDDKRCQLEATLARGGTLFVEHVDADLYAAISRAAARLKRAVHRELGRRNPTERGPRVSASGLPT